ncbi:MAG: recombinase family protein [Bacteroidales bacterium]
MEKLFVTYYRVSTQKQGVSGLGLDAQKTSVLNYISKNGNVILSEFVEIESGKNDNRPELQKALNLCKEKNATLVIAKLDRLSRNLSFISSLMDAKVKFICCDMPDASELTIHIFASLAQWERKRISERTKEALKAKKQKEPSWKPGTNNLTSEGYQKAYKTISYNAKNDQSVRFAWHYIKPLREKGYTLQAIADALNKEGYKTRTGKKFFPSQVLKIINRFK